MSQFLEIYNLRRLNYEVEDMNRPIMSKETESVIKNFQTKKSIGPNDFIVNYSKHLTTNTNHAQTLPENSV